MECPNCGTRITETNQKFCEKCGTELPSDLGADTEKATYITPRAPTVPYHRAGGLFDLNRNLYILKEKYWDWGSGDILDEKGQVIGRMVRQIISIRKRIEFQELDGTISATIHEKLLTARGAQDLKDPEGNLIARIKKKILSFFRPKFYLEDPFGNRWYEAQGELMGWSYKITNLSTGKLVAEIEKADRWKDVFLSGFFDFADTYALRILDNETDRRILLGFVISIDNILFDMAGAGYGPRPWRMIPRHPRRRFPGPFPRR